MTDWLLDRQQTMTTALPHKKLHHQKLKDHDTRTNATPPSQRTNDKIRKNNAGTTSPQTRLKRPPKLQKNDQTQKIRLNPALPESQTLPLLNTLNLQTQRSPSVLILRVLPFQRRSF